MGNPGTLEAVLSRLMKWLKRTPPDAVPLWSAPAQQSVVEQTPAEVVRLLQEAKLPFKALVRDAAKARELNARGVQTAAVQFRLNPDGSLKSFVVLNAGDQADEIAFIKAVIERSLPFSPFPPDIDQAARSLGVTICVRR